MTSIQFINALVLVDFKTNVHQQSTKTNRLLFSLFTSIHNQTPCVYHTFKILQEIENYHPIMLYIGFTLFIFFAFTSLS